MYTLYACKVNSGDEIDGYCQPEFDAELDLDLAPDNTDHAVAKENQEKVDKGSQKKRLTTHKTE